MSINIEFNNYGESLDSTPGFLFLKKLWLEDLENLKDLEEIEEESTFVSPLLDSNSESKRRALKISSGGTLTKESNESKKGKNLSQTNQTNQTNQL